MNILEDLFLKIKSRFDKVRVQTYKCLFNICGGQVLYRL